MLKNIIYLLLITLIMNSFSFASESAKYLYEGKDITPVVNYFSRFVKVLKKDVRTFHWDNTYRTGSNPDNLIVLKEMVKTFWDNTGTGSLDFLGEGLYFSIDPIATNNYGDKSNWSLLALTLPKDLRVLQISTKNNASDFIDYKSTDPVTANTVAELDKIFKAFDCNQPTGPLEFFYLGGTQFQPEKKCHDLAKKIFRDIFEIQVIAYDYLQAKNYQCNRFAEQAFLVTDPSWITTDKFQFYNKVTKGDVTRDERLEIQSLFLNFIPYELSTLDEETRKALKEYFRGNPAYQLLAPDTKCKNESNSECTFSATLSYCSFNLTTGENECKEMKIDKLKKKSPMNTTITEEAARAAGNRASISGKFLLWSDLKNVQVSKNTDQWVKDNIFSCSGDQPYDDYVLPPNVEVP